MSRFSIIAILIFGAVLSVVNVSKVTAQQPPQNCISERLTPSEKLRWYNPKPSPNDFTLGAPNGLELVFAPIILSDKGLYGGEKSTYTMGSKSLRVFETPLDVRISSPILNKQADRSMLLMGKYELSNGQYAAIMGGGQLDVGIQVLYEKSREAKLKDALRPYVSKDDPCYHQMTRAIINFLARPISFLSYRDYVEVIDRFNLYCIQQEGCGRRLGELSANRDYPAFIRLPTEHEWEFAARGGAEYAAGRISRSELQQDLPTLPQGKTLKEFVHFGNDPANLLPIGSRDPLFGLYDVIGNADELMLNPFTAENGFGAVGGHVVRGGSYSLKEEDLRVSRRSELASVFWDDDRKVYDIQYFPKVGIRLVVGLPIWGTAERRGSNEVADQFESEYAPVSEAGDIAGSTIADAKDLGRLGPSGITSGDDIGAGDGLDIYTFNLDEYASVILKLRGSGLSYELRDADGKIIAANSTQSSSQDFSTLEFGPLLPARYELHFAVSSISGAALKYDFTIAKKTVVDTGVPTLTTAALAQATEIKDLAPQVVNGFVGPGDASDIYPVVAAGTKDGLLLTVSAYNATIKLRFLDESQNTIGEVVADVKNGKAALPIPIARGKRGFVQVLTDSKIGTLYQLSITLETLTSSMFSKDPPTYGAMPEAQPYRGYLNEQASTLYFPIFLSDPRTMRIELSQLEANVDLEILDEDLTLISSDHARMGRETEIFVGGLAAGRFVGKLTLRETAKQTPFQVFMTSTEYKPTGGSQDNDVARNSAARLGILNYGNSSTSRYMTGTGAPQYFEVSTSSEGMLAIDVSGFSEDADIDVLVEDRNGNAVAKSSNTGAVSELLKVKAGNQSYFIRVHPSGKSKRYNYTISLSFLGKPIVPNFVSYGKLTETFGDWQVRQDSDGKCWMLTAAKQVEPALGWKFELPTFYIGVGKGSKSIYISLDYVEAPETMYKVNSLEGSLIGANTQFKLQFEKSWLKPLIKSKNCKSDTCVNDAAISAFVRGRELRVTGKTHDGSDASFTYSLSGYVKAARTINTLCKAKIGWIYGR